MYENIIGQRDVVSALSAELAAGRFPRAALFHGPAYSGKLSTALETARALTCEQGSADWSCECPSCRMQKELGHPNTVLMGARYADVELAASADALMRSRKPAAHYLFIRAVRKLTRRFDPAIMDADDSRMKGMPDKIARVEEALSAISTARELPPERELGDLLEKVIAAAAPVAEQVRGDWITIGQVRRLSSWAHLTASGARKVAIIESADRMQDSARNALLKLLEQPPESVHLVMLTSRRAAIIPTVLSRLRPYAFLQRPPAEERAVLEKIFRREETDFDGLRSFFLAWREINPEKLSGLARRFTDLALSAEEADPTPLIAEMLPEGRGAAARASREAASSFLEELEAGWSGLLRGSRIGLTVLELWLQAARLAQTRMETYNMAPTAALEDLLGRMREAVRSTEDDGAFPRGKTGGFAAGRR
jgi:DNA polymerase III delta prime subunit